MSSQWVEQTRPLVVAEDTTVWHSWAEDCIKSENKAAVSSTWIPRPKSVWINGSPIFEQICLLFQDESKQSGSFNCTVR